MKRITKRLISLLPLLMCSVATILAQQTTVTGKIIDPDGQEAIGASVVVKGTTQGVVADTHGNYTITVPDAQNTVLIFSYIGTKAQEIKINGKKTLNVQLTPDAIALNEVVSIGYGTVRRADITGAVSSVKSEQIHKVPVTSVGQALAGKVAGVNIVQSDGSQDASISIRVRGGLSITQDNEPLYIIDGFPSEDGLRGLDPSDIATIDVLKDASATAIYGARGGNGVVLITTKAGKTGKATINYDAYYGVKKLTNKMKLLSVKDFVLLEYERAMLGGENEQKKFTEIYADGWDNTSSDLQNMQRAHTTIPDTYNNRPGIDWQGLIFDHAMPASQNHKISLSGGTETTKYTASYSFSDDGGIMRQSGLKRHNIRLRLNQRVNKKLTVAANTAYNHEHTQGIGSLTEASYFSRMQHIVQYRPTIGKNRDDYDLVRFQNDPIRDDESGNQMQNPIVSIENEKQNRINKLFIFNAEATYNILKNLTYKFSIGYRTKDFQQDQFYAHASRQAINAGAPWGQRILRNEQSITYNNVITYTPKLPKNHLLDLMIGQEDYRFGQKYMQLKSTNFPKENFGLNDMALGSTPDLTQTGGFNERLISFFGRINYNLQQKYLATITLRADASSKFGANSKWGYFPSLSLAWRASEEQFIKALRTFSNLKLRLSYGTAGNNRIGAYKSLAKYSSSWQPFMDQIHIAYSSEHFPNKNLRWETNISANLGIDIGLCQQRLQIGIDLYDNQTKDLLLDAKTKLYTGYPSIIKNIGKTRNRGVELTINTVNIDTKNFTWETGFNISHNQNKVVQLAGVDYFTTASAWASKSEFNEDDFQVKVGQSVGNMYGYKWIGLYTVEDFTYDDATKRYTLKPNIPYDPDNYPKPGYNKFADTDNNGKITSADKQVIGNYTPVLYGGLTNTFTYRAIDFSFALNFSIGNEVYNANRLYFTKMTNRYRNALANVAERFTYIDEQGQNIFTNPERLAARNANRQQQTSVEGAGNIKFHSQAVEDGSYLRLSNITLGYTLPKPIVNRLSLSSVRCYTSAYNLLLLTRYSGFDPDVNAKPNGGITPGIDWGAYPRSMSFVVGINLSL